MLNFRGDRTITHLPFTVNSRAPIIVMKKLEKNGLYIIYYSIIRFDLELKR